MHSIRVKITYTSEKQQEPSNHVSDTDAPKYQVRHPYELTNAIFSTNEQYNDCFLLHSTIPSQSHDVFLQIVYGNENLIPDQPNSIGHCISADAHMSKGFAKFLPEGIPQVRRVCRRANLMMDQVFHFWDSSSCRYIKDFVTKEKYLDRHNLPTLSKTLQKMQSHAIMQKISKIVMPKIGCGLDQMNWQDVVKLLRDIFAFSDTKFVVYSLDEHAVLAISAEGDPEFYVEDEIDRYSEKFHSNKREQETGFTGDAKSCQPIRDERFPILRPKEQNESLFEYYLQCQPKNLVEYIKQFDFQYSDTIDKKMTRLFNMLIDSKPCFPSTNSMLGKPDKSFTLH